MPHVFSSLRRLFELPYWRNRNIAIIYYTYFATSAWFTLSMWYVFFLKVANPEQVALVHTLGFVVGLAFDIPSGYLADKFGRKRLFTIGLFLFSLGMGLFAFITAVWQMFLFEIITQLGVACISGAQESVLYNTVSSVAKEKANELFTLIYSKCRMIANLSIMVCGLAGGLLYYVNDKSNWLAMALLCFVAALLSLCLVDYHDRSEMKEIGATAHIKDGIKVLINRRNAWLLPAVVLLGGIAFISDWGVFSYGSLQQAAYDPWAMSLFFTTVYILGLFAHAKLPRLQSALGNRNGFAVYATTTAILLISGALCHTYMPRFIIVPLGLFIVVSSVFLSYLTAVVSALTTERHRATALSSVSFLSKFLYMVSAPLMGAAFTIGRPELNYWGYALLALIALVIIKTIQDKMSTVRSVES